MSADSPRRSGSRVTRQSGVQVNGNGLGQVVVPLPVTDPSIIDSVTGFINDVVPQAYATSVPSDGKEPITWARFESADVNDPALYPDISSDTTLPLLLVLGYSTGVQVWSIPANGEATEVLSWCQGSVRTLRILPSPLSNSMRSPDAYASKRPLVALCDSAGPGPGPPFCSVSFISLKTGDQVKSIKFKNQVCDVLANRRSVVVTFLERIAVFDACTLEDRLSITSCYPSPGPCSNPVTIGSRWLAFAEKKLIAWQRSSGGVGGSGTQSYTATVLHAAQTLGRGLRGLSETVASSLTGPRNPTGSGTGSLGSSPPTMNGADHNTPGVVTVLDLEASCSRHNGSEEVNSSSSLSSSSEGVVAHFVAHSEAIVSLQFDPSGLLLLTADRRGHNFHVFRVQPHPGGSSLAAVHHLYVLHRGDTSAKVQDVAFSCDSRWVAVSTLRGTTHVFPLTPYGGPVGFRTHGSPHVVNRLSRFHRSAGLSADGRSSPVPSPESPPCLPAGPHANPRLPPYPHATVQSPLSQLRQSPLLHPPLAPAGALDLSLRVCAAFGSPRTWLLDSHVPHPREGPGPRDSSKALRRAVDSLFVMAGHGNLVQYDLEPIPTPNGPREKICDDTPIDLEVEAKAQWPLQRSSHSPEVLPPLPSNNPLLSGPVVRVSSIESDTCQQEEHWLSQVEIITHAGPHRRLWMGPQITFKTYTTNIGCNASLHDVESVEVGTVPVSRPARSNPVNMPSGGRPLVPVFIESGSGSSLEQSPHLLEVYGADTGDVDNWSGQGDSRLREDLADAMLESPGAPSREKGKRRYYGLVGGEGEGEGRVVRGSSGPVRRVVNPGGAEITMWSDGEQDTAEHLWEAIAIPASAPVIPIPLPVPIPQAPPCHSHPTGAGAVAEALAEAVAVTVAGELVTTIPAAQLPRSRVSDKARGRGRQGQGQGQVLDDDRGPADGVGEGQSSALSQCSTRENCSEVDVLEIEASRHKSRWVAETTEPSPVCKKSKKSAPASDREIPMSFGVKTRKAHTMAEVADCLEKFSPSAGPKCMDNLTGKKVKKCISVEEKYDDALISHESMTGGKIPSPEKDISDMKGGKRPAFISDKDQAEDSMSLLSKKNKKKTAAIVREGKREDSEFESLDFEKCTFQQAKGKLCSESNKKVSEDKARLSSSDECENVVSKLGSSETAVVKIEGKWASAIKPSVLLETSSRVIEECKEEVSETDLEKGASELQNHKVKESKGKILKALSKNIVNSLDCQEHEMVDVRKESGKNLLEQVDSDWKDKNCCDPSSQFDGCCSSVNVLGIDDIERNLREAVIDISSSETEHIQNETTITVSNSERSCRSDLEVSLKDCCKISKTSAVPLFMCSSEIEDNVEKGGKTSVLVDDCSKTTKLYSKPAPKAWKTVKEADPIEDLQSFPTLMSKYNKKGRTPSLKETTPNFQKDCRESPEKESELITKKTKIRVPMSSETICPSVSESPEIDSKDSEVGRPMTTKLKSLLEPHGLEISQNHLKLSPDEKHADTDVEKQTLEDVDVTTDPLCTDEYNTSKEKMCLKENEKKKKIEASTHSNSSKKGRGKENVDGDITLKATEAAQKSEITDSSKIESGIIKQEEVVKPIEKSVTTPNKTSKSQRRKRR